jgi:hypothetical protein
MDFSLNNEALRRTLLLATALVLGLVVVGRTIGDYRAAAVREMRDVYELRELEYRKYARLLDNKERYLLLQAETGQGRAGYRRVAFFHRQDHLAGGGALSGAYRFPGHGERPDHQLAQGAEGCGDRGPQGIAGRRVPRAPRSER